MELLFFVSLRQLVARKLLNGIAVGAVSLGVTTLVVMTALMDGLQDAFVSTILKISPHVVVTDRTLVPSPPLVEGPVVRLAHERPSDRQLRIQRPDEILRLLRSFSEVAAAAPSVVGSGVIALGSQQYPVEVRGVDPKAQDRVTPLTGFVKEGRYEQLDATTDGIVLGAGVAKKIGAHVGDVVLVGSPLGEKMSLRVVAVIDSGIPPIDNSRAYVTLRNAQALLGKPDVVSRIEVRLADPDRAPQVSKKLESMLRNHVESWQETNANFLAIFAQQRTILGFVIGAILVVGGFGILAIQIMIVLQKTRDISILRSVGFQRPDILVIFLLQGAIVASLGALLGELLGKVMLIGIGRIEVHLEGGVIDVDRLPISEHPRMYVFAFLFALTVGLVASFIPAFRASRIEPVDVLRGNVA